MMPYSDADHFRIQNRIDFKNAGRSFKNCCRRKTRKHVSKVKKKCRRVFVAGLTIYSPNPRQRNKFPLTNDFHKVIPTLAS